MPQTRTPPQKQLQNYFDDLLAGGDELELLEEPKAVPEPKFVLEPKSAVEPQPVFEPKSVLEPKLAAQPKAKLEAAPEVCEPEAIAASSTLQKWQKDQLQSLLKNMSPVPEHFLETSTAVESIVSEITETYTEPASWEPLPSEWLDNGRPCWAQEPFHVLLFEVAKVHIAVPLKALDGIHVLDGQLSPLFGQTEWFMGLKKTNFGNIRVIDTGLFIMPERYQQSKNQDYEHAIEINNSGWALAVDKLYQPIVMEPESIKWRQSREQRPWIAGTLKDQLCVLLDIPVLAEILKNERQT